MTEPTPNEPSMEEILASIRRIISEDTAPGAHSETASATTDDEDDDVLVLKDRAPAEPQAEGPAAPGRDMAVARTGDRSLPEPVNAASAAESFDKLYFVVENSRPPAPSVSNSGPTLEDLTREMLKPMIKA